MAPSSNSMPSTDSTYVPTAKDVTTSGGVWAPTSAKRDKLAELRTEIEAPSTSLDDLATPRQKLDLWLVDGLTAIVKVTENDIKSDTDSSELQKIQVWLQDQANNSNLHQVQWEELLRNLSKAIKQVLSTLPPDRCLRDVRDYVPPDLVEESIRKALVTNQIVQDRFDQAVIRFRLLLCQAAAETLEKSWKTLTLVSDQDVDRAAVKGVELTSAKTLPYEKLQKVILAHLVGTCKERVDALWSLMDKDGDGLLDQEEMNTVCQLALEPTKKALEQLLRESLDAYPVSLPLTEKDTIPQLKGWRERRREAKDMKRLLKMFQKTLKTHFIDEVEMQHRLRCIYAWANKAHQNNRIESVMVEESGWSGSGGRQRYVELNPKISLSEFREVQQEHFTHIDRIGGEYLKSFREDLWIGQGSGRQSRELIRDSALFMTIVCVIDFIVSTL